MLPTQAANKAYAAGFAGAFGPFQAQQIIDMMMSMTGAWPAALQQLVGMLLVGLMAAGAAYWVPNLSNGAAVPQNLITSVEPLDLRGKLGESSTGAQA